MRKLRFVSLLFTLALTYIILGSHTNGQATTDNEDDTGAPTAKLCTSCHGGGSFGPVTTTIQVFTHGTTTAISSYQPGTLYDVTVTIVKGAGTPTGYGFEFTGLTTPGNVAISGYSGLASNVKQKTLTTGTWSGRTFTEHNGVTSNNVFAFSWTAPAANTGTIKFYASGNAVNGDGKDGGDNPSNTSLTLPEALGATGTTTNVLCFGAATGSITITTIGGTSPYTYNWGNGIISQNRTGIVAGTYTVTVTDNASNTLTGTFTVSQPSAALSVYASTTNVLCFGSSTGAINVTPAGGTAGYSYNWGSGVTGQSRSSLAAGNYPVTVTDNNGCTASNSFTVTQPTAQLAVNGTTTNVACFGGSTGAINITGTGGTGGYSYNWGSGITSQNRTAIAAGNYSVTITDNNSCTASNSFNVTQPATQLTVTGTATNVLCFGGNTGAINVSGSGGTPTYSYNWGNSISSQNRSSLTAGNYTVTVTDNNQCTASKLFTVAQPSAALSASATTVNVLCFGGNNGSIQLSPTGGTMPYTYNWGGSITTENRNSLTSGNYSVIIKDNNSCSDTSSFTITQPAKLVTSDTEGTITCFGGTTSIDITASGGASPYTGTGSFTVSAGTYNYTVTDANGCSLPASANIRQPAQLIATAGTITISCNGDSGVIPVTATGGTPPYTGTGNFTVNSPGSFTYAVTDSNGCSATATGTALAAGGLTDSFTVTSPACHNSCNGSILVFVSGGTLPYTFAWNDSVTGQSATGLCAGPYQQIITDSTGCSLVNNYVVPDVPAIEIAVTSDSIYCFGDSSQISVNVSGGTGPYSYQWNSGQTQSNIKVPAGSYSLGVTDNNHCSGSDSLTLYQPLQLSVAGATNNTPCFGYNGGSITTTVTGGVSPYNFSWNNDSTTMNITRLIAGEYIVSVTDNNICSATSSFSILQPDSISVIVTVTNDTGNNSGSIKVSASGGTPPYSYNWGGLNSGADTSYLGPGTYSVLVEDSNGCQKQINNIVVTFVVATTTSTLQTEDITLYPNPVSDKIFIHLPPINAPVQLQVLSAEGTLLKNEKLSGSDNWVDVSYLPAGLYLFEIKYDNESRNFKVSKVK